MPSKLELAQEKWARNTKMSKEKWINALKSTSTYDEYCKKIADELGVDVETVKRSIPAQRYKYFLDHADEYVSVWEKGIENAIKSGKWLEGYKRAFTSPASRY